MSYSCRVPQWRRHTSSELVACEEKTGYVLPVQPFTRTCIASPLYRSPCSNYIAYHTLRTICSATMRVGKNLPALLLCMEYLTPPLRHPEERSDVGISLDCHGLQPRNDAEIATSRADSRNDVVGILLPTRIVVGDGGWRRGCVCGYTFIYPCRGRACYVGWGGVGEIATAYASQ